MSWTNMGYHSHHEELSCLFVIYNTVVSNYMGMVVLTAQESGENCSSAVGKDIQPLQASTAMLHQPAMPSRLAGHPAEPHGL